MTVLVVFCVAFSFYGICKISSDKVYEISGKGYNNGYSIIHELDYSSNTLYYVTVGTTLYQCIGKIYDEAEAGKSYKLTFNRGVVIDVLKET